MIQPTPFHPRRWLHNGHVQTIVGNYLPRVDRLPAPTSEFIPVPLPPEMQLLPEAVALDRLLPSHVLVHGHWQPDHENAPTVILVHGLEGSSHSQYIVGNANKLWTAGCNVLRMNMRNCGATDALSPSLYHSGMSTDVLAVLLWAIAEGCRSIALAGYSMGGNLVLKAAGELGNDPPRELTAIIAVSPPMDLRESADALHRWQNRIYERRFLRRLRARYVRKTKLFPAVFNITPLRQVRSIRDFDEFVMTPHCGFTGAEDYYARAGASRVVAHIAVPTLILHACDDPFIRLTPTTRVALQANPHITLLETEHGGHCAFLEDPREGYDGYWAEARLRDFALAHTHSTTAPASKPALQTTAALQETAPC